MTGKLPKPQLRNLLISNTKKHLVAMVIVSISSALTFKYLVADPRKQKYADFYKTYDAEKSLKRMIDAGLMQSGNIE
ncbi:cytochrome c oxidase subunit 6C-2 [Cephus cinctus]|uniref:Cytochrome c oxidase subunit 6C-2 n=1 Tax=Cephus cinctus TaxID=211228 RepID=A0AAJ7BJ46_CEPCN|nr:cytochrome c oxidase subunit 6C-2 [Cephus cinctus]